MPRSKDRTHTPAGNVFMHGQMHIMGDGREYQHVGSNLARSPSRAKRLDAAPIAHGMKRQTTGALHPYLHGQAVQDETDTKLHATGRSVNIHPGMGTSMKGEPHTRGIVAHTEDGGRHLRAAGVLGRQDRVGDDFDTSHIGHKVSKGAGLPASPRGSQSITMTTTNHRKR